jgi:hypothetical protein
VAESAGLLKQKAATRETAKTPCFTDDSALRRVAQKPPKGTENGRGAVVYSATKAPDELSTTGRGYSSPAARNASSLASMSAGLIGANSPRSHARNAVSVVCGAP